MNALRPDFVMFMGDQVDYIENKTVHAEFRGALLKLEVPTILICGNNDYVKTPGLFIEYQALDYGLIRIGGLAF